MFVYEEAWDYNSYLESDLIEYKEKQEKIYEKINFSESSIKKIHQIDTTINLVIFAELYCPDCRALIPFVEKLRLLNSKINISIFPRKGNEVYLSKHSLNASIPTILMEDLKDGKENFITIFDEFPPLIKEEFSKLNEEDKEKAIYDYRTGKRNLEIENYLVDILTKK